MGYTLRIGELDVDYNADEDCPYVCVTAKSHRTPEAPAFGEPTDHTSERWPSYASWRDFTKYSGLYEMFFGDDCGLLNQHPGCVPLTEKHRREVNAALAAWKEKYPNAEPTYGKPAPEGTPIMAWVDPENPDENWKMTRLVWLHYWVNWALDNCEKPVFANS